LAADRFVGAENREPFDGFSQKIMASEMGVVSTSWATSGISGARQTKDCGRLARLHWRDRDLFTFLAGDYELELLKVLITNELP
jgi:hypothetical protein